TILSLIGEKPTQEFRGPLRQHATGNLRPVIAPAVTHDVPQRANGTGLIIECPEDEPAHTSGNQRAGTHRARLQRDHQIASLQPPLPAVLCCLSYRVDFGVAGGIAVAFARIDPPANNASVLVCHDRGHGHIIVNRCRQIQRLAHERFNRGAHQTIAEYSSPKPSRSATWPSTSSGYSSSSSHSTRSSMAGSPRSSNNAMSPAGCGPSSSSRSGRLRRSAISPASG